VSATDYTIDRRDIEFVLFEQLKIHQRLAGVEALADFDEDIYRSMLQEAEKLAVEVIAPVNAAGDKEGCRLDDQGNVTTPAAYKEAWAMMKEGGWTALQASPELGGLGAPMILAVAISEMLTGACPAFTAYPGLSGAAANLLEEHAGDFLKETCLEKMYSGVWGGTMCLTEADAGSSVGDNRCKATPAGEDGVFLLEGEKIFITGGDQDLTPENIVHLVLARTPGAPDGTRGLSIFAVPKYDFHGGARNDAVVVKIEHKMGFKGSATCVLALGASGPCRGWLIGEEGDGMRIMFHMMNHARIGVGIQGLATGAAAFQNAKSYARERVQGTKVADFKNADAERVAIIAHPDVRRMLHFMKVYVELSRSLLYTNAFRADTLHHGLAGDAGFHKGVIDLITPICKAHITDLSFEVCRLAVQTYGGYGYIGEYPVEQHLRDNKIYSIYEGTNGIQAMDLLGRKMRMKGGAVFMSWLQGVNEVFEESADRGFDDAIAALGKARDSLGAAAMHLGGLGMQGNLDGAMYHATPFLELFGTVALGIEALKQARIAHDALQAEGLGESEGRFYRGKLANLTFYVNHVLPKAVALSKSIRSGDTSSLAEDLFD
jgi:alkylation response protein AidB-like acyl-CoA dehydrogenase